MEDVSRGLKRRTCLLFAGVIKGYKRCEFHLAFHLIPLCLLPLRTADTLTGIAGGIKRKLVLIRVSHNLTSLN